MLLRRVYARKEPQTLENTTLLLGSVTYAVKARRLLARSGIKAVLVKLSDKGAADGCSHGIEIASSRFFEAVVILKENGVAYSLYNGGLRDLS